MASEFKMVDSNGHEVVVNGDVMNSLMRIDPRQLATAWVTFNGSSSIPSVLSSYNVKRVEKIETGRFKIHFENEMDDDGYVLSGAVFDTDVSIDNRGVTGDIYSSKNTSDFILRASYGTGSLFDFPIIMVVIFGGKNTPAPAQIELFPQSGSNEHGSWIKHADGTLVQTGVVNVTGDATKDWGGVFVLQNDINIEFPIPFTNTAYSFLHSWNSTFYGGWTLSYDSSNKTVSTFESLQYARSSSISNISGEISWQAIGRWK